ncbi:hypothetical protein SCARD494_07594 [Seiridium cardinale]
MQLSSIVTLALLPLLAVADGEISTQTSTTTLYKTITIQRAVSTYSATYSASFNSTSSFYQPTGTGSTSGVHATTTTKAGSSSTSSSSSTASPSIDNGNGAMSLGAANVAAAGIVGMIVAALMFTADAAPYYSSFYNKCRSEIFDAIIIQSFLLSKTSIFVFSATTTSYATRRTTLKTSVDGDTPQKFAPLSLLEIPPDWIASAPTDACVCLHEEREETVLGQNNNKSFYFFLPGVESVWRLF